MPPAISDDEASDVGDIDIPITSTTTKRASTTSKVAPAMSHDDDDDDDNEMLDVVGDDGAKDDQNGQGEEGDDDDLDEDEYIVEKILAHVLEADGSLKYKVKWEGYEKKSDQTWEEESNLRENAAGVLDEYLESVGGRDKILEEAQTALKTKKRGRPSTSTPTNGTKRRRNDSHPASVTPPASTRAWKPPQGSWEDHVESIDACHDENTGKLTVYLTWKTGQKTQHDTKVIYSRCPQKMLQFYERHVKIVPTTGDTVKDE
ncbi:heterochromatin protein one [Xylaria cf. heliscus]|nr:heterochromatin protein one [Xylaria cf. heliscus]